MEERAAKLQDWMRRHWLFSLITLIVLPVLLLSGIGIGWLWVVNAANQARFGPPPPTGQNCGRIVHAYVDISRTARADADIQTLTCFWNVYQSCQAATIRQTYAGTDAANTDTLTIERRGNHCALYGQEEIQQNTDYSSKTFLCASLSKEGDTLQVSGCDGQDPFTLEPRFVEVRQIGPELVVYEAYDCGIVGGAYSQDTPQQIESCFFTAYNQCLADSMGYDTLEAAGDKIQRVFYIDNHCGIAYQRGSYMAACASLEFRADGLHFAQCGDDGDIFIPIEAAGD